MNGNCVVVNVWGGVVQDVFSSQAGLQVIVVDWDAEGVVSTSARVVQIVDSDGDPMRAAVTSREPSALDVIAGSEIETAIRAAGISPKISRHAPREDAGLFALYDLDGGELVSTAVFCSAGEAADEIDPRRSNVKVVRILPE